MFLQTLTKAICLNTMDLLITFFFLVSCLVLTIYHSLPQNTCLDLVPWFTLTYSLYENPAPLAHCLRFERVQRWRTCLLSLSITGEVRKRGAVCECIWGSGDWAEEMTWGDESNVECSHVQNDCMTQLLKRKVFLQGIGTHVWLCLWKFAHLVICSQKDLQSATASKVVTLKCLHTNLKWVNRIQHQIH